MSINNSHFQGEQVHDSLHDSEVLTIVVDVTRVRQIAISDRKTTDAL